MRTGNYMRLGPMKLALVKYLIEETRNGVI